MQMIIFWPACDSSSKPKSKTKSIQWNQFLFNFLFNALLYLEVLQNVVK